MKKTLVLFIIILTVVGSSCKKDDNSDPNNLTGSTWIYRASIDGVNYVDAIKFTSATSCTISEVATGTTNFNVSLSFTYTYEPPDINFKFSGPGGETISGTINGKSLILNSDGDTNVYTKQ